MNLDDLRNEIDKIDEQIHDLIMKRENIVIKVGKYKKDNSLPVFHPARQMKILRKIIARHNGEFSKEVLVRLWLEMMGAFIRLQGNFKVAVYMPKRGAGYIEIARDTFGAYTPIIDCGLIGEVIDNVKNNAASVGIIPVTRIENDTPWWLGLLASRKDNDLHVVAKLPISGVGEGRGEGKEAYAIAKMPYEKTGKDISLLVLETMEPISISYLKSFFEEEKIKVKNIIDKYYIPNSTQAFLLEVSGYIENSDERLDKMRTKNPKKLNLLNVIGGYPIPFSAKELK